MQINHTIQICNKNNKVKGSLTVDIEFIQEYIPMYVEAAKLTLGIAVVGIIISVVVGLICANIQYYKVPVLKRIVSIYIELSRNTPLIVQLFLLYFGLPKAGIVLDSVTCAIVGLGFLGGSYMAETQLELGLSIGLTQPQIMKNIIIPQAMSVSVPAICANIIFLIKETSVFSAVALADLMYVAKDLIALYYKTDEALLMLVVAYLILLLPISIIATILERRLRYAGFGN